MNLKRTFFILLTMVLAFAASANPVSPSQAQQIAATYLTQKGPQRVQGVHPAAPALQLSHTALSADNKADYYVFNNGNTRGFIVIAAEDRAVPVLGYSDNGSFDPDNIPDGLKCLLESYAQEIEYLRDHPQAATAAAPQARNAAVKPLLTCNWNQNDPFNRNCPTYENDGATYKCATGCVATGAAQIMYYHKWPKQGEGTKTYQSQGVEYSGDFNHAYDWDNMIDNYREGQFTEQQGAAVATLMSDVGLAAEMNYGRSSFTSCYKMMDALRTHFHYNKGMKYVLRNTKTLTEWEDLIFEELNNKRPILYSGFTATGGHTFVLDGYNADGYFHFNWGWGSMSNGYFVITVLNPREQGMGSFDGGYNLSQSIVTGLYPQTNGVEPDNYIEVTCQSFKLLDDNVALGEEIRVELLGLTGTGAGYGTRVPINYAFVLTDESDEIIETYNEYPLNMSLGSRYDYTTKRNSPRKIAPSTTLTPGDYRLRLMYKLQEEEESSKYRFYDNNHLKPDYITLHVKDGKVSYSIPTAPGTGLKVAKFEYPVPVGDNSYFPATLTFTNDAAEYYGDFYIFTKAANKTTNQGEGEEDGDDEAKEQELHTSRIDVPTDGEITLNLILFAPRGAGDYEMVVRDEAGNTLYGPCTLTVAPSDGYVLEAASQLTTESYYMRPDNVNAHIDIRNSGEQDYTGCISYDIRDNGVKRASGISDVITIPAGETRTVNFKTYFEGQPDVEYNFYLFNIKNETAEDLERITAPFMLTDKTSGIDRIAGSKVNVSSNGNVVTVEGARHVNFYSVTGALVATGNSCTLPTGIYLVVADGTVHKIAVK